MVVGMSDQQEIQNQIEAFSLANGKEGLLEIAQTAFFCARSIGAGRGVEIEVERATRAQALYLGKGAIWRAIRRVKLGHRAMTGGEYLAP